MLLIKADLALASADWQINCLAAGKCETVKLTDPLFALANAIPGQVAQREIIVRNKAADTCLLVLAARPKPNTDLAFAHQFLASFFDINRRGIVYPDNSFTQPITYFFADQQIFLGAIAGKTTVSFLWQIQFNPLADNQYQARTFSFDADLIFECDPSYEQLLPTAGRSETVLLDTQPSPTPTCAQTPPDTRLQLKIASQNRAAGEVNLEWTLATGSQYYLRFGPPQDPDRFVHQGITSNQHRVAHLSLEDDYVFQVGLENGCALGPLSNRVTSTSPLKPEVKTQAATTILAASIKNNLNKEAPTQISPSAQLTPEPAASAPKYQQTWQACWPASEEGWQRIWQWLSCWLGSIFN